MSVSPDVLSLLIAPSPSGKEAKGEITINVTTDNPSGYSLYLSTIDVSTTLTHANGTDTIAMTSNTVAGTLLSNTWGYNKGLASITSTFLAVPPPASTAIISSSADPITNDKTTVTIGVKADTTLPSGLYSNTVVFTAITNFIPPPAVPPPDSYPDNIDPINNPGVRDVYPTTGWEGDVVIITSDELFTHVRDVKIGGTSCTGWSVINNSVVACELPAKPAGSTNNIIVLNGAPAPGTDVIDVSTHKHMKVTYFDPSQTTITISTTDTDDTPFSATYPYFHNESPGNIFDSTACAALTPSNSTSMNIPSSIAYVRDSRNGQVYKVKRMVDNKCWMIDNLKYAGSTDRNGSIINNVDGTTGIIFRNGEGPNGAPSSPVGSRTTYNTVSGSDTENNNNSNKAFWNNPMGEIACYSGFLTGNPVMANNTLTQCGYLYNWYAATGGTGTYGAPTNANGTQATGSICPINFRLPSTISGTGGPTTNGTSTTVADFPVLNASMVAGSLAIGDNTNDASTQAGWQPTGAWSGTYSGYWDYRLYGIGWGGLVRSSTAALASESHYLMFFDNLVDTNNIDPKFEGFSVRCLLP